MTTTTGARVELKVWRLEGEDDAGLPAAGWVSLAREPGEAGGYSVSWIRPGEEEEFEPFDSHHAARSFARSMAVEIRAELHDRRDSTADELDVAVESLDPASTLRQAAEALAKLIRNGRAAEALNALLGVPMK